MTRIGDPTFPDRVPSPSSGQAAKMGHPAIMRPQERTLMYAANSNRTSLPPDLQAILDDLGRADADARRLIEGITSEQVNWQPRANSWSVGQCLDHLARANAIYAAAWRDA